MIIFYHEMDSLSSGASVVIVNVIRGLVKAGEKVLLINFKDGALHKELYDLNGPLFTVADNDRESIRSISGSLSGSDTIFTTHFYSVFRQFKNVNPKILFYCVNTTSLVEVNRFGKKINWLGKTRRLIHYLQKNGGILFGDQYALRKNAEKFTFNQQDFKILPLPIVVPDKNQYLQRSRKGIGAQIGFTYIGRAVDWKIFPIKKVITDLLVQPFTSTNIVLHIVTDNAPVFQEQLPAIPHKGLTIQFHENLSQQELARFLSANSDIHFAMGAAALDGAKLGIPTILLDLGFNEFPLNYRYNFVHRTPPGFIGSDVNDQTSFPGLTMEELLAMARNFAELDKLSNESYQYTLQGHSISKIVPELRTYIDHCQVHVKGISRYAIRYLL